MQSDASRGDCAQTFGREVLRQMSKCQVALLRLSVVVGYLSLQEDNFRCQSSEEKVRS